MSPRVFCHAVFTLWCLRRDSRVTRFRNVHLIETSAAGAFCPVVSPANRWITIFFVVVQKQITFSSFSLVGQCLWNLCCKRTQEKKSMLESKEG